MPLAPLNENLVWSGMNLNGENDIRRVNRRKADRRRFILGPHRIQDRHLVVLVICKPNYRNPLKKKIDNEKNFSR